MSKARPVTVSNDEILRAVDERTVGADEARQDRLVALEVVSGVRNVILERELKRLTDKHGANHPRVAEAESRLRASSAALRTLRFEIERTLLTPPRPSDEAWIVFGLVRGADGALLRDVIVALADEKGNVIAPDKPVPTEKDGAFTIALTLPHRVRKARTAETDEEDKAGGTVHLEVFRGQNKRIAVDTIDFRPAAAVVDYREIVVRSSKRSDKRTT